MWPFLFQYGFSFHCSTAGFLTDVPNRISRASNKSGATQAVAFGISYSADTMTSPKCLDFGLKDVLDWSEMEGVTIFSRTLTRRLPGGKVFKTV